MSTMVAFKPGEGDGVASVAAYALLPSGDKVVTELVTKIVEAKLPEYIAKVRALREGGAR